MKSLHRNSWKSGISGLSKTTSHDSCLDQLDDGNSCASSGTGRKKQCYSVPACEHNNKRRATIISSSSPASSLIEISKTGGSGSNKFMSFLQKGFHGHKSKGGIKSEKEKTRSHGGNVEQRNLQDLIPIPIRETAIQGHSKTLFHKVPNSNLRAKPLIVLAEGTKIVPIHPSILSSKYSHCVKIMSVSPNVYRDSGGGAGGQRYELMLPSGATSLGHTCRILTDEDGKEKYPSCHSSQVSLFSQEQARKMTVGYIFSCASGFEQKKWINILTRVARPNQQNERRKEISLNLWIQEAKNVAVKKRYFCEIYLDGVLHARTTTKMMGDMLFWGEEFNLCNLDEVNVVALLLWKCADEGRSKKKKSQQQLICQINIPSREIDQRSSVEKWYSASTNYNPSSPDTPTSHINQGILSSVNTAFVPISQSIQITALASTTPITISTNSTNANNDQVPVIRVKARYQHLDVLPLSAYSDLIKFLNDHTVKTLAEIEPHLKVKAKEDLAQNLIRIIHKQGTAVPILCDLIINEINKSEDKNLILRGNTMASKAMEIYLKLVGEKYLQLTLSDFINRVLLGQDDCEVDPQKERSDHHHGASTSTGHSSPGLDKGTPPYSLLQRQESLMMNVDMIWAKIMSSYIYFPKDLKTVFVTLRQRLHGSKPCQAYSHNEEQPDLCDRIISACIFLRYICPAILTPSLFGLIPEYPDNTKVTRTFTLVAKCIQTLANFSNLSGTKESYMVFMNHFIENNFKTMRDFLREISGTPDTDPGRKEARCEVPTSTSMDSRDYLYWENLSSNLPEDSIDMALCLATLHRQLEDCLQIISPTNVSGNIRNLQAILKDINVRLRSSEEVSIKNSHSYQNIRLQPHIAKEYSKRTSIDTPEYNSGKVVSPETLQGKPLAAVNGRPKPVKPSLSRVTSNSHSAESTPTHQVSDKCGTTAEYLMTQSMIDHGSSSSKTVKVTPPSHQVDKEWKAMLSASYAYNHKSDELLLDHEMKSSTSSGYQTLSRSTDSIDKTPDEVLVLPKSPTSSLKPSVKKCKQARRQTEIVARPEIVCSSHLCSAKIRVKDPTIRSVSSEEIRLLMGANVCPLHDDSLDCSSTQTLTAVDVPKITDYDHQPEERCKLTNSISMPVVHSLFDADATRTADFYYAFQGIPTSGFFDNSRHRSSASDTMFAPNNGGRSAFRDAAKAKPSNHGTKNNQEPPISLNDTDQIKYSLHNVRQTLNTRMKQLLLADRTTIQLELERVRLMRCICDSSSNNGTCIANNMIVFGDRQFQTMHMAAGNGPIPTFNGNPSKTISVKKYLDLAENVLTDVYNGQGSARVSVPERDMEDLLVHIFQTNQNLQNTLMSKSDKVNYADVSPGKWHHMVDGSNRDNSHHNQQSFYGMPSRSFMHTGSSSRDYGKSHSLGSLAPMNTSNNTSTTSTITEVVDAV